MQIKGPIVLFLYLFFILHYGRASPSAQTGKEPGSVHPESPVQFSGKLFLPDYTFSINLIPFLLLLKTSFFVGVIAKDFLAKEMRRYVESQSDFPVETFYQSHSRHDGKDIGNRNDDVVGRVEVYRDNPVDEFFPTLAAKYGYSVLASTAKSVAEYLFGGRIFPVQEPPTFTDPSQAEGYFPRTQTDSDDYEGEHLGEYPGPPYVAPPRAKKAETAFPRAASSTPLDPSLLSYDPVSETLFVPSAISEALRLEDGDVVPLPHDLLGRAVAEGNIRVVTHDQAVALEGLAKVRAPQRRIHQKRRLNLKGRPSAPSTPFHHRRPSSQAKKDRRLIFNLPKTTPAGV